MPVYKRNNKWWFSKTINGKRLRKALPTARTKAQAEEAERKELEKLHNKKYGIKDGVSMSMVEFAETVYLKWAKENHRSDFARYHLMPIKAFFGKKTFEEISPLLVEKYKSERKNSLTRSGAKRKPATVNRELACLSRLFTMAIEGGYTDANPCSQVKPLPEQNQRTRYLLAEEQERLLAACIGERAHLRPIIIIAVNSGMRRGEILSLRWQQIDLQRGLIHLSITKSGKSRAVPINKAVREELLKLDRKQECLFLNSQTGKPLREVKRSFREACREARIDGLHFHDLRHTAATRLMEGGADPFTIASILGHADLRMTARYTHAAESRKREALEKIAEIGKAGHNLVTMKKREVL